MKQHFVAQEHLSAQLENLEFEFVYLQLHDTVFDLMLKLDKLVSSVGPYHQMQQLD